MLESIVILDDFSGCWGKSAAVDGDFMAFLGSSMESVGYEWGILEYWIMPSDKSRVRHGKSPFLNR